jgi:hypothetical protein
MGKYMSDLDCPRHFEESMSEEDALIAIDWLVSQAILFEYRDLGL